MMQQFIHFKEGLLLACIFFFGFQSSVQASDRPKFLLIHLDAGSTYFILQEFEKGNLPNLAGFFGDEGIIDYAITYFPSKTPTVISSIREGDTPRESALPGWKYTNEERTSKTGMVGSFFRMAFSKSRLATTNLIYGLPIFSWMAAPALINTADYLKDYNVIQFYWYSVDTQGHFNGRDAYLNELQTFDRHIGRLLKRLDDDVNIIIYSDHGMTFGQGVEIDTSIENLVGDELAIYSYPTLFIHSPEKKDEFARTLVEETEIDYTFYEVNKETIKGYHQNGIIYFIKDLENETIRYQYKNEDVLGYSEFGYQGEYLTREEWLTLTYHSDYPMAPVNIYYHLNNEFAGDIVTLFNDQKFHQTGYSSMGNHGGFTYMDMTTPLFIKGPEVELLKNRQYYWLPDLFNDIEGVDFDQRPPRERHSFSSRYNYRNKHTVTEVGVSPRYRVRYGVTAYNSDFSQLSDFDRVEFWGRADLFRSYLSRLWVGTGFEIRPDKVNPLLLLDYDIHIRRLVVRSSIATNRNFYFRASFEATPWLAIETVNFTSLGLRIDF